MVVGVDVAELDGEGPQPSRHAAAHAVGLARREGARLVGVWVRPPVAYADTFAQTVETIAQRRAEAEAEFRERAARAEEHFGLPPGCIVVRDGDPAVELMSVAQEVNADGIVVGASSQRIGSVAGHLVRHSPVPVTVVP
jgi:nucleotide-binding universal stress UspA family protein